MKHEFTIRQRVIIDLGLDLDPHDEMILQFIHDWRAADCSDKLIEGGKLYAWCSDALLLGQVPLLRSWSDKDQAFHPWKPDTVQRRIASLIDRGYLKSMTRSRRRYLALGDKATAYFGTDVSKMDQQKYPDENPVIEEIPGFKSVESPDLNPDNHNIYDRVREHSSTHVHAHEEKRKQESCAPPKWISIDDVNKTVTGMGVTVTFTQSQLTLRAAGKPGGGEYGEGDRAIVPSEPDFYWWRKLHGCETSSHVLENAFLSRVHDSNWADVAYHSLLTVICNPDKEFRATPINYLKKLAWQDEIIDRRKESDRVPVSPVDAEEEKPTYSFGELNANDA